MNKTIITCLVAVRELACSSEVYFHEDQRLLPGRESSRLFRGLPVELTVPLEGPYLIDRTRSQPRCAIFVRQHGSGEPLGWLIASREDALQWFRDLPDDLSWWGGVTT